MAMKHQTAKSHRSLNFRSTDADQIGTTDSDEFDQECLKAVEPFRPLCSDPRVFTDIKVLDCELSENCREVKGICMDDQGRPQDKAANHHNWEGLSGATSCSSHEAEISCIEDKKLCIHQESSRRISLRSLLCALDGEASQVQTFDQEAACESLVVNDKFDDNKVTIHNLKFHVGSDNQNHLNAQHERNSLSPGDASSVSRHLQCQDEACRLFTLSGQHNNVYLVENLSRRSDGSATSFAFPVLESEWNSSPVRMARADRRHRSWKPWCICYGC